MISLDIQAIKKNLLEEIVENITVHISEEFSEEIAREILDCKKKFPERSKKNVRGELLKLKVHQNIKHSHLKMTNFYGNIILLSRS